MTKAVGIPKLLPKLLLMAIIILIMAATAIQVPQASAKSEPPSPPSIIPSNLSLNLAPGMCYTGTVTVVPPAVLETGKPYKPNQQYKIVPKVIQPGGFPPDTVTVNFSPPESEPFLGSQAGNVQFVFEEKICASSQAPNLPYMAEYAFEIRRVDNSPFDNAGKQVIFVKIKPNLMHPILATDLIAGGGNPKSAIDAGDVLIYTEDDYIHVTYVTADGWCLSETHLHVATSLDGIPQKNGNPIPGQFDYEDEHECITKFTYMVDYKAMGLECGTQVFIAAHAVVNNVSESMTETAWGEGPGFPGRNWAMYIPYTIQCP